MAFGTPAPTTPETPVSPIEVRAPVDLALPLVFASPHSGCHYPPAFVATAALELGALRRSEDCYVDELFSDVPDLGAPLLRALYPRAFLDVNREPYELDPAMFEQPLPAFVNTTSARVAAGLGTIARIVASRREIYREKLAFAEAEDRINTVYKPYHRALRSLVNTTWNRFGYCILIDCHSMPSTGLPVDADNDLRRIDIVLGDRSGTSCAPVITDCVEMTLSGLGYRVTRNIPYSGGFTTQHYGDPMNGVHAIQIEINRNIYMDEVTLRRRGSFPDLKADINTMVRHVAATSALQHHRLRFERLSAE
ncbi:MAG: N-formylglutamate amidohydrolase [Rhodospirillaceae bacterium]|nr:N-formylglutamate amidohydrolase [Rhodospirillaceae bacterium]